MLNTISLTSKEQYFGVIFFCRISQIGLFSRCSFCAPREGLSRQFFASEVILLCRLSQMASPLSAATMPDGQIDCLTQSHKEHKGHGAAFGRNRLY